MTGGLEILRARARALSVPIILEYERAEDVIEVLMTDVEGERLGIPMESVTAIAVATLIAPLPRAVRPEYGVAAWRGRPLTVFTLGTGLITLSESSRFVIIGDARRADVAVFVDAVDDAISLHRTTLVAAPENRFGHAAMGLTPDATLIVDVRMLVHHRAHDAALTRKETGTT